MSLHRRAIYFLTLHVMCWLFFAPSSAQSIRSKDTIFVFGNWRIDLIRENRSLQLVGVVTEGTGAYFVIQCFAEGDPISIQVPIHEDDEIAAARKRGSVWVTAWNERGDPVTVPMASFGGAAGVTIADKRKLAHQDALAISAFAFLAKLQEAKSFFAFEAGGPTRTYDAKHLSAARHRFERSCADIRTSWSEFLGRL